MFRTLTQKTSLKKVLSILLFIVVFLIIIDASIMQIQMLLFKNVYIQTGLLRFPLLALLILGAALFLKEYDSVIPRKILYIWLFFVSYLFINIFIISRYENLSPIAVIRGYNLYYFYMLILPLFFFVKNTLKDKTISGTTILLLIPLSILGIFQFITNSPIVYTSSPNGRFNLSGFHFYGKIRIFSLFDYGWDFAFMLSMGIAICMFVLFAYNKNKKFNNVFKIISLIELAMFLALSYMTLTRNVYLQILTVVLFCVLALKVTAKTTVLKIIAIGMPVFLTAFILLFAKYYSNSVHINIFNSGSLHVRLMEWFHYTAKLMGDGPVQILFGAGVTEGLRFTSFKGWGNYIGYKNFLIDNGYLAVLIQTGIIGFVLWFAYLWTILDYVLNEFAKKKTAVTLMSTALIFSLFTTNMFANTFVESMFVVYFLILSDKN